MPRINARECRFTGEIFTSDTSFKRHLRRLRKDQQHARGLAREKAARNAVFTEMRATCKNASDIERFIADHWPTFVANGHEYMAFKPKKFNLSKYVIKNISIDIKWGSWTFGHATGMVSNTHASPVTGPWAGKSNWGGIHTKEGIPTSYLGWTGRISFEEEHEVEGPSGSDFFDHTGINTGSGGGGSHKFSYDLVLFADDWPGLMAVEQARIDRELAIKNLNEELHRRRLIKTKVGFQCAKLPDGFAEMLYGMGYKPEDITDDISEGDVPPNFQLVETP